VVEPDTEKGLETKVRAASLTQKGKPAPPLDELLRLELLELGNNELRELDSKDELLERAEDEDELDPVPPCITNCAQPVSIAPPVARPIVK
jgi:hypothetical protein